jgi:hypothetical protein
VIRGSNLPKFRIIPHLYCEQFQPKENAVTTKAIRYRNLYLSNLCDTNEGNNLNGKHLVDNMPFPFSEMLRKGCDKVEFSLSKIITKLYNFLLTATSNYFIVSIVVSVCFFFLVKTVLVRLHRNSVTSFQYISHHGVYKRVELLQSCGFRRKRQRKLYRHVGSVQYLCIFVDSFHY